MRKNVKKIIIALLILICVITAITYVNAFAGDINELDADYNNIGSVKTSIDKTGKAIIAIIRVVSVATAIVMLLVISMRYMISAPGDRADIKKHAVAYVVGAIILFGVSGILTIIYQFSSEIGKTSQGNS